MMDDRQTDDLRTVLRRFECELIRKSEESFSKLLTGRNMLRFRFGNGSYTDGRNITVDPSMSNAYSYVQGIVKAEKAIGAYPGEFSTDPLNTLHAITRALNIHECLHIIFTRFPVIQPGEPRALTNNGAKILASIINIIEDYYIEEAGCMMFDNMHPYLMFLRTAIGEAESISKNEKTVKLPKILSFLNYMIRSILYPMVQQNPAPNWMIKYIKLTTPIFNEGCTSNNPDIRYECACKIFDILSDIIPEKDLSDQLMCNGTGSLLDKGTVDQDSYSSAPQDYADNPKPRAPLDPQGEPNSPEIGDEDFSEVISEGHETAKNLIVKDETIRKDIVSTYNGSEFPGPHSHDGINIVETDLGTSAAYVRSYEQRRKKLILKINALDRRFRGLFVAESNDSENKLIFGTSVDSKRLWDSNKRYWKRTIPSEGIPNIGVLLLIDGSGSMEENKENTIDACICIHEILEKSGIRHEIAEHRAHVGPSIEINILKDSDDRGSCGSNIMRLDTNGCNRDGLAVLWAESQLKNKFSECDARIIIIVSDGLPHHENGCTTYSGESARKDVCGIKNRMKREGMHIIAVSLDKDDGELTEKLKDMYDHVICCTDTEKLPRKLFDVMAGIFTKMF